MRLVAKHGLHGAARILPALVDEVEAPWKADKSARLSPK